jgi:hypothetical protein
MDRIHKIPLLDWFNFPLWKGEVQLALLTLDCDHAIHQSAPALPTRDDMIMTPSTGTLKI